MVSKELEQLLALQRVDLALDDIAKREEEAHARLKAGREGLEEFKAGAEQEKKLLNEALKEHKTLDLDLKKSEEEVKKHSTQMYEVKTNKEYTALKDEIDRGRQAAAKLEDRILQLMIREDELKATGVRRAADLAANEKQVGELEAETKALLGSLSAERGVHLAEREAEAGKLGSALLRRYEQIRKLRGGSPLSLVKESPGGGDAICSECHMTIRPQVIVDIYRQSELVACEYCGRILHLDLPETAKT